MARRGWIPVVRIGRQVRVEETQLRSWIAQGGRNLQAVESWSLSKRRAAGFCGSPLGGDRCARFARTGLGCQGWRLWVHEIQDYRFTFPGDDAHGASDLLL